MSIVKQAVQRLCNSRTVPGLQLQLQPGIVILYAEKLLPVAVQAEKQALRVKLRRAGSSAADVVSIPAAAEQEQQQPQRQPLQLKQQQPAPQSSAAQVHVAAQPDVAGPAATDSLPGEHRGAEAAGAAASPDSTAEAVSAPAAAILPDDSGAGDAAEQQQQQQQQRSRRIAAAATAAATSARAAAADAAAAGPSVAVLQQLLPWRVKGQGAEVAGVAEPTSPAAVASMSADEAVRWATQRHAATLSAIHSTLEQLAEEKRSCLAALEAQQVRGSFPCLHKQSGRRP